MAQKSNIQKLPITKEQEKALQKPAEEDLWYTIPQKGLPPKLVPTAVQLQRLGNDKKISTRVLRIERDEFGCRVWVVGSYKDDEGNEISREAVCDMDYSLEAMDIILSKLQWGKVKYKMERRNGLPFPQLVDRKDELALVRELLRLKRFSVRSCTTRAENIVIKKLLGGNFYSDNPEEKAIEAHEVDLINNDNSDDKPKLESIYYIMGLIGHGRKAVDERIRSRYKKEPAELNETELRELWSFCQNGENSNG
ncbi:hypothetical protein ACFL35_16835 [Candidatus Riflebacteria bacterium]